MVSPPPPPPPPDAQHLAFAARLQELGRKADASGLPQLFEALESPEQGNTSVEPIVRELLRQVAGRDPEAAGAQLARWARQGSMRQRSVAAVLLAELGDLRAVVPLIDIYEQERQRVGAITSRAMQAERSLDALAIANPPGFADKLIQHLDAARGDRRLRLTILLARTGDARALPFLRAERDQELAAGRGERTGLLDAFGQLKHIDGLSVMLEASRVDDVHVLEAVEKALAAILSACVGQADDAALEGICRIPPRVLVETRHSFPFGTVRRRFAFAQARERAARELEHRRQPVPPPDGAERCAHCGQFFVAQDNVDMLVNCNWHPGRLMDRDRPDVAGTGRAGDRWDCCGFVLPTDGNPQRGGCAGDVHAASGNGPAGLTP
jgi:hypothetical protein